MRECYDYAQVNPSEYEELKKCKEYLIKLTDPGVVSARDIVFITGMPENEAAEIVEFVKQL